MDPGAGCGDGRGERGGLRDGRVGVPQGPGPGPRAGGERPGAGRVQAVLVSGLADGTRFGIPSPVPLRGPRPDTGLEGLPAAAVEEASWWEAHIAEVVYGLRPDAPAGTRPRPQYDPERTSLTEREK